MILHEIYVKEKGPCLSLTGIVECTEGKTKELFFEYPAKFRDFINVSADAFFPVLLIPAMKTGEDLMIKPQLSESLLRQSCFIQDIFTNWFPDTFRRVDISCENLHANQGSTGKSAQFFSLGVDSFYTLLKNKENNIRYIIYMQGLELPLSRYKYQQEEGVMNGIAKVEKHYNVELIHGKTNIRDHYDLDWPKYYHGAGLAATAISLAKGFDNIYIPSSHSYGSHIPIGSSFMLDHYWSTEHLKVVHDGAERGRSYKISEVVMKDAFALNHLRVCTENDGGDYNCCRCRKCITTMLTLDILGILDTCEAFPYKNLKGQVPKITPQNLSSYALAKDLYCLAIEHKRTELAKKIEKELLIGRHDLYGRKELSIGLRKYILGFIKYLWMKTFRGS